MIFALQVRHNRRSTKTPTTAPLKAKAEKGKNSANVSGSGNADSEHNSSGEADCDSCLDNPTDDKSDNAEVLSDLSPSILTCWQW